MKPISSLFHNCRCWSQPSWWWLAAPWARSQSCITWGLSSPQEQGARSWPGGRSAVCSAPSPSPRPRTFRALQGMGLLGINVRFDQEELEGGRNCVWQWTDIQLLCMHRTNLDKTLSLSAVTYWYLCMLSILLWSRDIGISRSVYKKQALSSDWIEP